MLQSKTQTAYCNPVAVAVTAVAGTIIRCHYLLVLRGPAMWRIPQDSCTHPHGWYKRRQPTGDAALCLCLTRRWSAPKVTICSAARESGGVRQIRPSRHVRRGCYPICSVCLTQTFGHCLLGFKTNPPFIIGNVVAC
jgi:hypothetical protein